MLKRKRSLFERITGTVKMDEFDDVEHVDNEASHDERREINNTLENPDEHTDMGQLSVDVINQPEEIIIRAIVAGVKPHELDVQISRDMVVITGTREENREIEEQDFYHRELYWGSFSRKIILPEEIDVELSTAEEKHGLLELHLTKIDKNKKTKLQVKSI
jgi:HSP20 family protein